MNKKNLKITLILCIISLLFMNSIAVSIDCTFRKSEMRKNCSIENNGLRNIMLTGFWDPTGQMLAQFSTNSDLNPDEWKGENWENLGFNVHSFFPTPGVYDGDFEVDYQDTQEDFLRITEEIKPIAIISFGAGMGQWEIEYNANNFDSWSADEEAPYYPTPNPPDDTVPVDFIRHSTLPIENIEKSVNEQLSVDAWIDWNGNPGRYLCGYMAYLGMWYQNMHNTTDGNYPCRAAGFIHVNPDLAINDARNAAEITIRETIGYLINCNLAPNPPTISGPSEGNAGVGYEFNISSIDPDGDQIYYLIKWSDSDEETIWDGPFESGENIIKNHIWDEQGVYNISVKAKDSFDAESKWAQFEITMPKNKQKSHFSILEFFEQFFHRSLLDLFSI